MMERCSRADRSEAGRPRQGSQSKERESTGKPHVEPSLAYDQFLRPAARVRVTGDLFGHQLDHERLQLAKNEGPVGCQWILAASEGVSFVPARTTRTVTSFGAGISST